MVNYNFATSFLFVAWFQEINVVVIELTIVKFVVALNSAIMKITVFLLVGSSNAMVKTLTHW